jgi:L-fuconolactonase
MRLDSHQHFWKYSATDYHWMDGTMDVLRRDYLPKDLNPELDGLGFDGTIAVQARRMERETDWLLELADEHAFIRGVVGWADFTAPHLDETLERFAANPKLKGLRELIHDMPAVDYAVSDVHTQAIAKLSPLGLTYDLLLKPQHLPFATKLARQFPNQPFVVDHMAKPDIASGIVQPWRQDIETLAACENVYCKLSGLVTEATWRNWHDGTFRPYLDIVLETFGADRLMIGSDWPVCLLSANYATTMGIVVDFAKELSNDDRDGILGDNAARFYGLDDRSSHVTGSPPRSIA